MTEIIDYLKPFAIKVIENNRKLNPHEFILHLEKEYIQAGGDNEWFSENKEKIFIKSSRLIDTALTEWLKKQYNSYPHKTRRDETSVICGKVSELENVSASSMYSYSTENGWSLWQTTGMESGKKLQIIHLQDETEPYYVVWTKDAIGIRVYNIIDFQWETKNNFRIILKKSLEGHGIGFGGSKPITIDSVHYPSIISAYNRILPDVSYSTICTRIRKGMTPKNAFYLPNQRINSDINKLGIRVKKGSWIKQRRNIS